MKTMLRLPALILCLGSVANLSPAAVSTQSAALPTITTQPTSVSVGAGGTATFTVIANGDAPLSYQWAKGGAMIPSAKSATLTLNSVTASDAGSYAVTVSNLAGSVTSDVAALVVTPIIGGAPTITQQPTSQTVAAGSSATFSVTATGQAPLTFSWFKESRLVSNGGPSFTIAAATAGDAGTYYVVVTNPGGSVTSSSVPLSVTSSIPPLGAIPIPATPLPPR